MRFQNLTSSLKDVKESNSEEIAKDSRFAALFAASPVNYFIVSFDHFFSRWNSIRRVVFAISQYSLNT